MKPLKGAESGIPDLWTDAVENGYYIVPYYFLDEKGNEHTVTVYHCPPAEFDFLNDQNYLIRSKLIRFTKLLTLYFIFHSIWSFVTTCLNKMRRV